MDPRLLELYHSALADYRAQKDHGAAEKLKRLISESPAFEDAYEALSVILYNQKNYAEAVEILRAWIRLNPDAVMARTNLSRCYAAQGMILEAEREQAEARRLTWKADLKAKKMAMPKVDFEEQIARFKKVIELDPADVLGYFSLGNVYLEAGKKREALETFRKAVDVDPAHSSSFLGLGQSLEALGDKAQALDVYRQGIRVADSRGDLMTLKKMESRMRELEKPANRD